MQQVDQREKDVLDGTADERHDKSYRPTSGVYIALASKGEVVGQSASQAAAFYRDVAKSKVVFTVQDDGGVPAPLTKSGRRSLPLWSSRSRVERIIKTAPAYRSFRVLEVEWAAFVSDWMPGIKSSGTLVGVNWSGSRVIGYDMEPEDLVLGVEHAIRFALAS